MNSTKIHITGIGISILKKLIGQRIMRLYSVGLDCQNCEYWSREFSIDYTNKRLGTKEFRPFIEISADYKLSKMTSTTYFEFEICELDTPTGINRSVENYLEWPFSKINLWTEPISKIEIYQDENIEGEAFLYDSLILFTTKNQALAISAADTVRGGVSFTQSRAIIDDRIKRLTKRREINTQPNS